MSHWSQLLYSIYAPGESTASRWRFSLSRFLCSPLEKTTLLPSDPSVVVRPLHQFPYLIECRSLGLHPVDNWTADWAVAFVVNTLAGATAAKGSFGIKFSIR